MKEHALLFGRDRSLIGVLTESGNASSHGENSLTGVLLLSSGLDHHVGPNRIYVKLARLLSEMGFVVLRFSFSGIGDSGPRRDKLPADKSVIDETQQAMDCLERMRGVKKFVLMGLCSGAGAAFLVAAHDQRVRGAVLINAPVPKTPGTELAPQHTYYWRRALFNLQSWKRFLYRESDYQGIWKSLNFKIKKLIWPGYIENTEYALIIRELREFLQSIRKNNVQLFFINTDEAGGEHYLHEFMPGEYTSLKNSGIICSILLKGADHVIRPLAAQSRLLELISNWMAEKF